MAIKKKIFKRKVKSYRTFHIYIGENMINIDKFPYISIPLIMISYLLELKCDDVLTHVNWRKMVNKTKLPKYWLAYINKSATTLNMPLYRIETFKYSMYILKTEADEILIHFNKVLDETFQCEKHSHIWDRSSPIYWKHRIFLAKPTHIRRHIFNPTISINMKCPKGVYCSESYFVETSYKLLFVLHKNLRLNITFKELNLREVFGTCDLYNLSVKSYNSSLFTYCGIHSQFSLYPPTNNITISMSLYYEIPTYVQMLFSVISKSLLENQQPFKVRLYSLLTIHYLVVAQLVINTYKVNVKKFYTVYLTLYQQNIKKFIVFHGPGILSRKTQVNANDSNTLNVGTFQCLIQVLINKNDNSKTMKSSYFSYKSQRFPRTLIKVTDNNQILASFSSATFKNQISYNIRSPKTSKIKLNIISYTFEGRESSKCDYGGIALFDYKLPERLFKESTTICNEDNHREHTSKQTFYSSFHYMMIVGYEYKEYSSVTFNASISRTHCNVAQINPCILTYLHSIRKSLFLISPSYLIRHLRWERYYFELGASRCVILQFLSKIYWDNSYMRKHFTHRLLYGSFLYYKDYYCNFNLTFGKTPEEARIYSVRFSGILYNDPLCEGRLCTLFGTTGDSSFSPKRISIDANNRKVMWTGWN